ncbi:MAG: C25 family cysteine peptidase, partial [Thermoproteota archaeon]
MHEELKNELVSSKSVNLSSKISRSYTLIKGDAEWDQITGNGNISFIFNLNSYEYENGIYSFNYSQFTTAEGFPILPFISERFILPSDALVTDILITEDEKEILTPPSLRIFISESKSNKSSEGIIQLSSYNSTYDIFPRKTVYLNSVPSTEYGVSLWWLLIFPFQACRNGSVLLHKKINITIIFFSYQNRSKTTQMYSKFLEDAMARSSNILKNINEIEKGLRIRPKTDIHNKVQGFIFIDEESFFSTATSFSYFYDDTGLQHYGLIMLRPNETELIPQAKKELEMMGYATPIVLNYTSLLKLISEEWIYTPGIIVTDINSSIFCSSLASYLNWPLLTFDKNYYDDIQFILDKFIKNCNTTIIFRVGNIDLMTVPSKIRVFNISLDNIPYILAYLQWNDGYLSRGKSEILNLFLQSVVNPEDYNSFANQDQSINSKGIYYLVLYSSSNDDNLLPAAQMLASYRGALLLDVAGYTSDSIRLLLNYYNPVYVALYGDGDNGEVDCFFVPDIVGDPNDPSETATDFYYMERNECHPPDTWPSTRFLIDSFVGRPIAASDLAAQEYVNLIYLYENGGLSSYDFIRWAALFSYEFGFGDASQDVHNYLSAAGATYLRWYKRSNGDFTKSNVLWELDTGLQIAYFNTHGSYSYIAMGSGSALVSSDLEGHDFINHPTYLHVDACLTARFAGDGFDDIGCIATRFMDRHILGYVGSTMLSWVGYFDTFDRYFFKYIQSFTSSVPLGMLVAFALEDSYYQFGPGDFWGLSAKDKITIQEVMLLGDPAVRLYFGNDGAPSDVIPPTNPTTYSSNPLPNVWSNDNTVYITWSGASDYGSGVNGYWYRWTKDNHGDPTGYYYTTSTSTTSSPLSDGIWYFNIRSRDNAGNDAPGYVYCGPFKIDTTPPGIPSPSGPSGWTADSTPHITWSAVSDSLSGVAGYEYAIDQTSSWTWIGNILEFDTPPLPDGYHVIYIRAKDNAGNYGSPGWCSVYIDTIPPNTPSLSESHCGSDWTTHNSPYFAWPNPGDTGSGVVSYEGSVDNGSPFLVSSPYHPTWSDGVHTFRVRAVDGVGLRSSWSNVITIKIDTTPPAGIVIINGGTAYTNSPSVTLTLDAVDGVGSGVVYMCFSNDGFSWSPWEYYSTSKSWVLTPGDGTKTVYVKYKDYVGLESSPSSDTIILDTSPPTTPSLSSPNDGARVNPRPTFSWVPSSDSTSGVASYIL